MSTSYTCPRCRRHHDAAQGCDPTAQLTALAAAFRAPEHEVREADEAERAARARHLSHRRRNS